MPGVGVAALVFVLGITSASKNKTNLDVNLNRMMTKLKDSLGFHRNGRITCKDLKSFSFCGYYKLILIEKYI